MGSIPRAARILPAGARLVFSFSLFNNQRAFWFLQIPATICFFLFGFAFLKYIAWLRPDLGWERSLKVTVDLQMLLFLLVSCLLFLVLHELIHGLFFAFFTRNRPVYGLRAGFAFAAAPGWFFSRAQYVPIGLAPLILLTMAGMLLAVILPVSLLFPLLLGMTANAAGAVGDIWIIYRVLRERGKILVEDLGDGFNFYTVI